MTADQRPAAEGPMERQEARERVEAASRPGRKGGRTARAREIEMTLVQVERVRRGRA